jgi:hypothetical protein
MEMKVNLSRPDITEAEIEAVCQVLRSPNLSLGPKLRDSNTISESSTRLLSTAARAGCFFVPRPWDGVRVMKFW